MTRRKTTMLEATKKKRKKYMMTKTTKALTQTEMMTMR
jgi:hypothetical protein